MNMMKNHTWVVEIKFMFIRVLLSRLPSTKFCSVVLESMQGRV